MTGPQQEQTRRKPKVLLFSFVALVLIFGSYLFGLYSYPRNIWPFPLLKKIKYSAPVAALVPVAHYDDYGRLIDFPNKTEVGCPVQAHDTAVLLVIGQSNSANHAEKKFTTEFPQQVFNYYDRKCYVASSPMLGATSDEGEFATPLADNLIRDGTYKSVVIVSAGIGGTPIARWQQDGDVNELLLAALTGLKNTYNVTDIVWHQGESDFQLYTSAKVYVRAFHSLLSALTNFGIAAPSFISVSTKCGSGGPVWRLDNPTAEGQKMLVDNKTIFLGANTDTLLERADRREDDCHFSESGQIKTATAYAESMKKAQRILRAAAPRR